MNYANNSFCNSNLIYIYMCVCVWGGGGELDLSGHVGPLNQNPTQSPRPIERIRLGARGDS